jgi:hypothetical protein
MSIDNITPSEWDSLRAVPDPVEKPGSYRSNQSIYA